MSIKYTHPLRHLWWQWLVAAVCVFIQYLLRTIFKNFFTYSVGWPFPLSFSMCMTLIMVISAINNVVVLLLLLNKYIIFNIPSSKMLTMSGVFLLETWTQVTLCPFCRRIFFCVHPVHVCSFYILTEDVGFDSSHFGPFKGSRYIKCNYFPTSSIDKWLITHVDNLCLQKQYIQIPFFRENLMWNDPLSLCLYNDHN